MFANAAINWASVRQQLITLSSLEAELVALNEMTREMAWVRNMLKSVGIHTQKPLLMHQDNESTKYIAEDITNDRRTKHLDVREKYVNLCVEKKMFDIKWVPTESMVADIFTKPLAPTTFLNHRDSLGLVSQATLTFTDPN
jgi:KUP system potassium uptake protein